MSHPNFLLDDKTKVMIFINYRHEDTGPTVAILSALLKSRYGKEEFFVDTNDMEIGSKWREYVEDKVSSCRVLLVVIGARWAEIRFKDGENANFPKLADPEDWVRKEICMAIEIGGDKIKVIVVKIADAKLPQTKWHCALDKLHDLQHARLRPDKDFNNDFEELCDAIEKLVPELKEKAFELQKTIREKKSSQFSDYTKIALEKYLETERLQHAIIQLPLIFPNGHASIATLNDLRIDLPLVVSHMRVPNNTNKKKGSPENVEGIIEEIKTSYRDAYRQEKASRTDNLQRNFNIFKNLKAGSHIVIVGDPGSGKSTLLQWITQYYAWLQQTVFTSNRKENDEKFLPNEDWVPLLISCKSFNIQNIPMQLNDLLKYHFKLCQYSKETIALLVTCFETLLQEGRAILLIDGLDEIPQLEQRQEFCQFLNSVATHFPKVPVIVTSRGVGFRGIEETLSANYDHVVVAALDHAAKRSFVENWAQFIGWSAVESEQFIKEISEKRSLARLTDNILLLALVSQIQILDQVISERRLDVYVCAVQLLIKRQRKALVVELLTVNEIVPHLEFLSYNLRKKGLQRFTEAEAIKDFEKIREHEKKETILQRRTPRALLKACIESLGILQIAGTVIDSRGYERYSLQFFHQSFQEYFAGQAIVHEHDCESRGNAVSRLRSLLEKIEICTKEINVWGQYKIIEPVFADNWQETVRFAIAGMTPEDANDAILMILPNAATNRTEARARAVFALMCLAEEPKINQQTANAVFDSMIDNLWATDGFNKRNTWMDEAINSVSATSFGKALLDQLVMCVIQSSGEKRNRAGSCFALHSKPDIEKICRETADQIIASARKGLSSNKQTERVQAALELMNGFFEANGKLGFLSIEQQASLIEALTFSLVTDEATQNAAIWAILWLTDAKNRQGGTETLQNIVYLPRDAIRRIEQCLRHPQLDEYTLAYGCLVLTREQGLKPIIHQRDWIYELAVIADGVKLRRELHLPDDVNRSLSVAWILDLLHSNMHLRNSCRIAQALGSFGVFVPEMVKPLQYLFTSEKYGEDSRDEALIYLAMIGTPEAKAVLVEAADTPDTDKEKYSFYSRGLFGLLLVDDIDILAGQIRKALPDSDLDAYAYGLAGSSNPLGRILLEQFENNSNERIRNAANKALGKSLKSTKQLIAEKTVCILLVRGAGLDGDPIFTYVAVRADKLETFMEAQKTGTFYPEDFGVIIESGEGEPSDEIRKKMEIEYGFNHKSMLDIPDAEKANEIVNTLPPLPD